ncbi:DUF397 domain-containing protein [Streptomyces sp. NPDC054904]|uniref:DUF397 domain-containing protein n=1 Tax=unclassified Streptomyces TaxID=2593676 RepID=UPI0029A26591|nr:DUF397 domain-containing protein [Streptomyces sp. DK15]MDX2395205.1 DUF397 domain-containing protein [Streptomyces sp. DK15]
MAIRADDLDVHWFSSSHSNDQGGQCVQGGRCDDGSMAVRDSKTPHGAAFRFAPAAWQAFVDHMKAAAASNA